MIQRRSVIRAAGLVLTLTVPLSTSLALPSTADSEGKQSARAKPTKVGNRSKRRGRAKSPFDHRLSPLRQVAAVGTRDVATGAGCKRATPCARHSRFVWLRPLLSASSVERTLPIVGYPDLIRRTEVVAHRHRRCLGPILDAELSQDVCHMVRRRANGDRQRVRDLLIA